MKEGKDRRQEKTKEQERRWRVKEKG